MLEKTGTPSFLGGDVLTYMLITYPIAYCYMLEGRSGKSLQHMIDTIGHARITKQTPPKIYSVAHRQFEDTAYYFATSLTHKAFNAMG